MTSLELAEAMLKGLESPGVEESRAHYIDSTQYGNICMACALGVALIGKYNGNFRAAEVAYDEIRYADDEMDSSDIFARLLDISPFLAEQVETMHLQAEPIMKIAAWLKERGGAPA
mgnify:CR=1 FL=1